jgi:hypothetical protein
MSKDKVQSIQDRKSPSTQKDIQSFLGFTNIYSQFINNFSKVVKLLTDLTKEEFERK